MIPSLPRIDPLSARLPDYCVDWRFLLPLRPGARLLLWVDSFENLSPYFSGLEVMVTTCGFGNSPVPSAPASHQPALVCDPLRPPFAGESVDIAALPFGFPNASKIPPETFLTRLGDLLKPAGVLLLGTSGRGAWSLPALKRALGRGGFEGLRVYGIAPDLLKPAFLMPLTARSLGFYVRRRLAGKPGGWIFSILSRSFVPSLIQGMLPGYFLTAVKGSRPAGEGQ